MKTLSESFESRGYQHKLEFREQNIAVYRRWKEGQQSCHWECIIVREQKERVIQTPSGLVALPHAELYPTAEQFGTFGFTYTDYESAKTKALSLLKP